MFIVAQLRRCPRCLVDYVSLAVLTIALGTGVVAETTNAVRPGGARPRSKELLEEGSLRDVFFVDSTHGWAVGDGGLIWHTQNGGEKWRRQHAAVHHHLQSVYFLDAQHGWAVGGATIPLTKRSQGVILTTNDGGQNWKPLEGTLLPWLCRVRFDSPKRGIVAGLSTPLDPTGVWETTDGGRTWNPLHGVSGHHWVTAALERDGGLLVSDQGVRAWLKRDRLLSTSPGRPPGSSLSAARSAAVVHESIGLAATPDLNITLDQGRSWTRVGLPGNLRPQAICARGNQLWVAGSPGTHILHSADNGATFRAALSQSALPQHALWFHDQNHGWAVGAFGSILRTENGGQSWRVQRGMGMRAAILAVFMNPEDIPWELLSQAALQDAYRVHCVLLTSPERVDLFDVPWLLRMQDAGSEVGVSTEVLTDLPWDRQRDLRAGDQLRAWQAQQPLVHDALSARLTELVRAWRPEVVLTATPDSVADEAGVRTLVTRLLADACELASSDRAYPEQLQGGLAPWTVTRSLAVQPSDTNHVPPTSAWGAAAKRARQRMTGNVSDSRLMTGWKLVSLAPSPAAMGTQPCTGLNIPYASASRRQRSVAEITQGPSSQTAGERRRKHVLGLLRSGGKFIGQGRHGLEQALQLLASFPAAEAGEVLFELAQASTTDPEFSSGALQALLKRYPEHALAPAALLQLVEFYGSQERVLAAQNVPQETGQVRLASAIEPVDPDSDPTQVRQDRHTTTPAQRALRLGRDVKSKWPAMYAEPRLAFALAAAARADGQPLAAQAFYRRALALPRTSPWRQWAAQELSLAESGTAAQTFSCAATDRKPHLDGHLQDELWQEVEFVTLGDPSASEPTTRVALAHDAEYLYFAASCRKVDRVRYLPARRPRPRDALLQDLDRVCLRLDVDRDYGTWFTFEIDQRGWTRESAPNQQDWNPRYFVASASDDQSWAVEVAIPLSELRPAKGDGHWAVGIERIVPRTARETWRPLGLPESHTPLQGILSLQ